MGTGAFMFMLVVGARGVLFMFVIGIYVHRRRSQCHCLVRLCCWWSCSLVRQCPFTFVIYILGRGG